jgi:hypothetical protein
MTKRLLAVFTVFICWFIIVAAGAGADLPAAGDGVQSCPVWYFWTNQTGRGSYAVSKDGNVVTITDPGPNRWSVGISGPGISVEKGKKYLVEFEAKSDVPIEIISQVYYNSDPWTSYSGENAFTLTGKMAKYSFTFTMRADSDPKAGLQFMFGGQVKAVVTYDKVTVKCLGKDLSTGDADKDPGMGTGVWYFWTGQTGQGAYKKENSTNIVTVTDPGPNRWSTGISENGLDMISGNIYRVDFEAKSDPPIEVTSQVYFNSVPWTSYSKGHIFKLSKKMEKYSYSFTMSADTDPKAGLQFMFGGQKKSVFTFDKVSVTNIGKDASITSFPKALVDKKVDKGLSDCTVFAFGQSGLLEDGQQIYKLKPDINIRSVNKWGVSGKYPADYNFSVIHKYHYLGVLYTGGITTAIQKQEFKDEEEFKDMATRDAKGELVSWSEFIGPDMYRGALANPKYRAYLLDTCKMLIDAGADAIHFDEPNSSYMGGPAKNWSNNEGFDDYSISDFNRYLVEKYPDYKEADWKERFKMTDDNIIKRDVPADDLGRNFNYRKYLQKNGWTGTRWGVDTVLEAANPLAKEWGKQIGNREYQDGSFTATYIKKYLKEIFDSARGYAMEKYGKKLLTTTNGIAPGVDFNSLGIYLPNPDNQPHDWKGLDYVPVKNGRLNGSFSEMDNYKTMYNRSRETSGDVPLVFFLDFPNEVINSYYKLPLDQKKDFWRIYAAEAYAAGCYYAFHLSTVMDGEPTAEESGVLDFLAEYAKYYRDNSVYYHDNAYADNIVTAGSKNISFNLMKQEKYNRVNLHVINHDYKDGIIPQKALDFVIALEVSPKNVYMISPDFAGKKSVDFKYSGGKLVLKAVPIQYYDLIAIEL